MTQPTASVLFGAAYYPEYQPTPRWDKDLRLMREAGFTVIRVGESVWSTWEPRDGEFDLEWLAPILDTAESHGISVVLGTPTYAVPMWLARQVPEINVERRQGERVGWGARQEINHAHPAYLFHAERVIRRVIGRYAEHPAVIGFQVDNEPGAEIIANTQFFEQFVDHLRRTYGSVAELNEQWGLTYWSHRLSDWADLWRPEGNAQPQYALAWRRFQATMTTAFIGWQAEIVREYAREDQFVTTCISYDRETADEHTLGTTLDVTAGNPYYRMQDALALPYSGSDEQFWITSGVWALLTHADRMYATKQAPFLVTETNAQAIGEPWLNEPGFDGQYRQVAWALVSRGAQMIEYWHWHSLKYGTETYWSGVLPHSEEPGRVYREIASLGREFQRAGDAVAHLTPHTDVTLLFDNPSKWAQAEHPVLSRGAGPDPRGFQSVYEAYSRGVFEAGLQAGVVHAAQLRDQDPGEAAARRPVLVAAAFTIATDADLNWLRAYAEHGGHLVLGIRTGYEDQEGRARSEVKPAHLSGAAGVWYEEFSNLRQPVGVAAPSDGASGTFDVPAGAAGTLWADGVRTNTSNPASVLARYEHPHFGRFAAASTKTLGRGRITYVGTVPNQPLASALMRWAFEHSHAPEGGASIWRTQSSTQSVATATNRHGALVQVVHNWAWEPSTFTMPGDATDAVHKDRLPSGTRIELGPWDVRVFLVE